MRFMIYELWDPGCDHPFYVGWTDTQTKGTKRPTEHIRQSLRFTTIGGNRLKRSIIRKIYDDGYEVSIIEVSRCDDLEVSLQMEKDRIAHWGRRDLQQGPLSNMTDGGQGKVGVKDSPETRSKKAAGRLGKTQSDTSKELIRQARANQPAHRWSDDDKNRMREKTHFRKNKNKTTVEIYGTDRAALIAEKQSRSHVVYNTTVTAEQREERKKKHFYTCITKMRSQYESIFSMLHDGISYAEISRTLGVSKDTVRRAVREGDRIRGVLGL